MKHLFQREDRNAGKWKEITTGPEWVAALNQFPQGIRYHAANLAGHAWDVVIDGDRLLVCCSWSGGHWIDTNGQMTALTDAEIDQLYPPIPKPDHDDWFEGITREQINEQTRYRNACRQHNKVPRQREIVLPS